MSSSMHELLVESSDPLATLEVVDAKYKIVGTGVGTVRLALPNGLYIARARSGDRVEERTVRMVNQSQSVSFDQLGAFQHGPILTATTPQAGVGYALWQHSNTQKHQSWIAVATKYPDDDNRVDLSQLKVRSLDHPDHDEYHLRALSQYEVMQEQLTDYMVVTTDLEEGWYALVMPGNDGLNVLLPLYVSERTSPTIFVESVAGQPSYLGLDLDRLLVSYDEREAMGLESPLRLRAIELTRRSLESGCNELTPALMNALFAQKLQDPMLGLLMLQLLLIEPEPAPDRFREVMHTMTHFFGVDHPDLVIARAKARQRGWDMSAWKDDHVSLTRPPLLRVSWEQLLELDAFQMSIEQSELLRSVAASLVHAGVWVAWKSARQDYRELALSTRVSAATRVRAWPRSKSDTLALHERIDKMLDDVVERARIDGVVRQRFHQALETPSSFGSVLDRTLVRTVLQLAEGPDPARSQARTREQLSTKGLSTRLAHSLSVPLPLVDESIANLKDFSSQ